MRIFEVLRNPWYLALAIVSTLTVGAIYIYTQILGILHNFWFWLSFVPRLNLAMLVLFSVLFVVAFAYQAYLWRQPKACSLGQKTKAAGTSGIGTIGIFLVAQCPACASLGAYLLPLSVATAVSEFGIAINLFSIIILLFTLNYLGAFKK